MLNPATRNVCCPWMRFIGRSTSRSITLSTRTFVMSASVTIFAVSSARERRKPSSSRNASSSAFRSGSNAASDVGNDPVITPQTTPMSVWTRTSDSFSIASMASNAPPRIAMTCMGGNPHFAPTASANAAIATVSFAM